MDGAGWHRSKDLVVPPSIRIVYLPPYFPELNLVERLWVDLKRKTIRNKVYESLEHLEHAVISGLNALSSQHLMQLCSAD